MSGFNPQEHFEEQLPPQQQLFKQFAEIYKSAPETVTPGIEETLAARFNTAIDNGQARVLFDSPLDEVPDDPRTKLEFPIQNRSYLRPHTLEQGKGFFILHGDLDNGNSEDALTKLISDFVTADLAPIDQTGQPHFYGDPGPYDGSIGFIIRRSAVIVASPEFPPFIASYRDLEEATKIQATETDGGSRVAAYLEVMRAREFEPHFLTNEQCLSVVGIIAQTPVSPSLTIRPYEWQDYRESLERDK